MISFENIILICLAHNCNLTAEQIARGLHAPESDIKGVLAKLEDIHMISKRYTRKRGEAPLPAGYNISMRGFEHFKDLWSNLEKEIFNG